MNWYFNNGGAADGPHDESAMAGFAGTGRLDPGTLVWQPSMAAWQEAVMVNATWWQSRGENAITAPAPLLPPNGRGKPKTIVIPAPQPPPPFNPPTERRAPVPSAPTGVLPVPKRPGFFARLFGRRDKRSG